MTLTTRGKIVVALITAIFIALFLAFNVFLDRDSGATYDSPRIQCAAGINTDLTGQCFDPELSGE